jgi:hypothetical protein
MLRKTSSGTYERQDSDGNWVAVTAEEALAASSGAHGEPQVDEGSVATMIDTLVDELHADANGTTEVEPEPEVGLTEDEKVAAHEEFAGVMDEPPVSLDTEAAPGSDFDLEVPGLVSGDTGPGNRCSGRSGSA